MQHIQAWNKQEFFHVWLCCNIVRVLKDKLSSLSDSQFNCSPKRILCSLLAPMHAKCNRFLFIFVHVFSRFFVLLVTTYLRLFSLFLFQQKDEVSSCFLWVRLWLSSRCLLPWCVCTCGGGSKSCTRIRKTDRRLGKGVMMHAKQNQDLGIAAPLSQALWRTRKLLPATCCLTLGCNCNFGLKNTMVNSNITKLRFHDIYESDQIWWKSLEMLELTTVQQ